MIAATLAVLMLVTGPPNPDEAAKLTIVVGDGGTQVHNRGASWVSVQPHQGKTQVVSPGQRADFQVGAGEADPDAAGPPPKQAGAVAQARPLVPPSLLSPADKVTLKVKPQADKGFGPVVLSWQPVSGAREYEVELQVDNARPVVLKVSRPEARLPNLAAGKVLWAVRSVGDGASSELSEKRWFEVQPEQLKLEVKGSGWK